MLVVKAGLGVTRRDGGYTLASSFLGFTWQSILLSLLRPLSHACIRHTHDRLIAGGHYFEVTNSLEVIYISPDSKIGPC